MLSTNLVRGFCCIFSLLTLVQSQCYSHVGSPELVHPPEQNSELSDIMSFPGRYGNPLRYEVMGKTYDVLPQPRGFVQKGIASWYGIPFHNQRTANGEIYDMHAMTAAHKTLPIPSYVLVENMNNHREVVVRINDRGPFHGKRIIDLSYAAAKALDMVKYGTAKVKLTVVDNPHVDSPQSYPLLVTYAQVGAFKEARRAQYLKATLQAQHIPVFIQRQSSLLVVICGPFIYRKDYQRVQPILSKLGIDHPYGFFASPQS